MTDETRVLLRHVASNVRRLRKRARLTQQQFADAMGVDFRFISRIERGAINMQFDTLVRLAMALKVAPGLLLRRTKLIPVKTGRPRSARG